MRGIIVNPLYNLTDSMLAKEYVEELLEIARKKRNPFIVSDEIT